jgi:hypothetical protein
MIVSDYHRGYASPPPQDAFSSQQTSKKRKRVDESEEGSFHDAGGQAVKKTREGDRDVVIPLSPPSSLPSVERSTPEQEQTYHNPITGKGTKQVSFVENSPHVHHYEASQSDGLQYISSQNRLLHELHMKSRAYEYNQSRSNGQDSDEDMWEEEEESVAERYAEMNKLLGSRRMNLH